jgi:CRISPR-associated protein Csm3
VNQVKLYGRVILRGEIRLLSGLHIGGSAGALSIGSLDLPVIRNVADGKPYIPGSSLKGKMRSLSEKLTGSPQNAKIGKEVYIHVGATLEEYRAYWVNPVFGVPGEVAYQIPAPNRLIVRDVLLSDDSAAKLAGAKTDLPYTEVKWEAAIDRVTSAATPRQIERVPAGAVFAPMEVVFSVYLAEDVALFHKVLIALQLVEDDYLGGQGTRGSGKVAFQNVTLECTAGDTYTRVKSRVYGTLGELIGDASLQAWLNQHIPVSANAG